MFLCVSIFYYISISLSIIYSIYQFCIFLKHNLVYLYFYYIDLINNLLYFRIMEWLFGKRITPEEMLRKNQRALNKAMRDLDREKVRMEQQEKKIIADIKKLAKDGQMVISLFSYI